ncbi:MAG: phytanoyl-CoA dioxygenase family protein [Alphaproteobacteria bacterium]
MSLTEEQLARYRECGHLTVEGVFAPARMVAAAADAEAWGNEWVAGLDDAQRAWYLERGGEGSARDLRKLDQPVFERPTFRALAEDDGLLALVEGLIGPVGGVAFSQIFFKAPEIGGPKPAHQDNFYFGPDDDDGMVTAWIALDDATVENGCMFYGEGSQRGGTLPHVAPEGQPFNLMLTEAQVAGLDMAPAPVPRGGVSFHHGDCVHRSADNRSPHWRRACAVHYYNRSTRLVRPALTYDFDKFVRFG